MEKCLTTEVLVRIPQNKNLTNYFPDTEDNFFQSKRFTTADLWHLQKSFNTRKLRRNNLLTF
jgi:hypothetical protein